MGGAADDVDKELAAIRSTTCTLMPCATGPSVLILWGQEECTPVGDAADDIDEELAGAGGRSAILVGGRCAAAGRAGGLLGPADGRAVAAHRTRLCAVRRGRRGRPRCWGPPVNACQPIHPLCWVTLADVPFADMLVGDTCKPAQGWPGILS